MGVSPMLLLLLLLLLLFLLLLPLLFNLQSAIANLKFAGRQSEGFVSKRKLVLYEQ